MMTAASAVTSLPSTFAAVSAFNSVSATLRIDRRRLFF
jgi:hypothetical protein